MCIRDRCSTMAITTSFFNGLGMGVSVLIILTLSLIHICKKC